MKKSLFKTLTIIALLTGILITISTVFAQNEDELSIKVTLTVKGTIDTYDDNPNDFADPLYYIWLDTNGNPNDGGYGNGQGTYQVGIQLGAEWTQIDSPRLHFWGPGSDGIVGTSDDEDYYLSETVPGVSKTWKENNLEAKISADGKSFIVVFPISKIGSPNSLEVSFMTATTTSASTDNLDPTTPLSQGIQGWIGYPNSVNTTTPGSYSKTDATETITEDFDIIRGEVEIFEPSQIPQNMRESVPLEIILPVGAIVILITAFLTNIGPTVNSAITNLPIPKSIKSFLKFYGASLFSKVDKIKIKALESSSFFTNVELISLAISVLLTTIIYGIVEANGLSNFLNPSVTLMVIPSVFLSVGIITITKVTSNAFWAKSYKVYQQFSIWLIGVIMFIVTGILFLFPFSSPGITRYQSDEISKKTKAYLIMFKTFTVLTLLIPFSILFMFGYQIIGDSGLLLTLMSTCYSLVPLKFLSGKVLFDYKKEFSLLMLFSVAFLFYGCMINLLPPEIYLITGVVSAVIAMITQKKLRHRL